MTAFSRDLNELSGIQVCHLALPDSLSFAAVNTVNVHIIYYIYIYIYMYFLIISVVLALIDRPVKPVVRLQNMQHTIMCLCTPSDISQYFTFSYVRITFL